MHKKSFYPPAYAFRQARSSQIRALQKWRLKRVVEYVENHLSERIRLSGLGARGGLLRTTTMPIVEIAPTVGFQTQAHLTTVFKRFAGCTPGRWRAINQMPIVPQPEI